MKFDYDQLFDDYEMVSEDLKVSFNPHNIKNQSFLVLYTIEHYSRHAYQVQEKVELNYFYNFLLFEYHSHQVEDIKQGLQMIIDLSEAVNDHLYNRKVLKVGYLTESIIALLTAGSVLTIDLNKNGANIERTQLIELDGVRSGINCIKSYGESFYILCERTFQGRDFWSDYGECYRITKREIEEVVGALDRDNRQGESQSFDLETREKIGLMSMKRNQIQADQIDFME